MLKLPIRLMRMTRSIIGERHRPVAADDALGRTDAGAIDQDARRAVVGGGLLDRRLGGRAVRHVAGHRDAFDAGGHFGGAFFVEVEDRHLGAGGGERARGGRSQSGCAAGDDRRLSLDFHGPDSFTRLSMAITREDSGVA